MKFIVVMPFSGVNGLYEIGLDNNGTIIAADNPTDLPRGAMTAMVTEETFREAVESAKEAMRLLQARAQIDALLNPLGCRPQDLFTHGFGSFWLVKGDNGYCRKATLDEARAMINANNCRDLDEEDDEYEEDEYEDEDDEIPFR